MHILNSLCGTAQTHCCNLGKAGVCQYLVKSQIKGFVWACSLRNKVNSWTEVYVLPEYKKNIKPHLNKLGIVDCGNWPPPGVVCNECGQNK